VDDGQITLNYTLPMPPGNSRQETLSVLGIVPIGGPFGTVPELLFEKKQLIPALQQFMVSQHA
ncbi:MAG: hypothetical protein PHI12_10585, partial [Dehalococcoidales bacterium]|nr:hypothetical protein [Dehalococcoidales bacterium]